MAFLDATQLNDLQSNAAINENRFEPTGVVDLVADSTPFVDYVPPSAIEELSRISSLRALKLPALKDQTPTVVTTPGFAYIPSNLAETAAYSFTAYDVFTGFRFYPAAHDNSHVDAEWFRDQTMANVVHAAAKSVETILLARMSERKSQVLGFTTQVSQGDGTFTFNTTPDTLEISKAAQKETMFYNLEALMAANDLGGNYRIATSRGGLAVQKSEAAKYGANNDKNLQALGMMGVDRMYESNGISAGSDVFNGYLVRDGAIGMFENHPHDFRNMTEVDGRKWSITDVQLPFARMRANVYVNNAATDATALVSAGTDSNLIMTHFEEMAIWFRFYVVYRYNSDLTTRANDIVHVSGKTS